MLRDETHSDPTKTVSLSEVKQSYGGILKDADMTDFRSAYVNPDAGWNSGNIDHLDAT